MAMEGPPEGVDPSGSVPEQLLQAAPILKRRRRRNREGFAKKGSSSEGFRRGVNIGGRGGRGDPQVSQEGPWRGPGWGRARHPPGCLVVAPFHTLVIPEGSVTLIFYLIFLDFSDHFK